MEKNRSSKLIAIVALVVAVLGLSLGFAAFSTTLNISPEANVSHLASTFKVVFSSSQDSLTTGTIEPTLDGGATGGSGATINNDADGGPSITGLTANFSNLGQTATYDFYVHNSGEYDAYLKSITYGIAESGDTFKKCTAGLNPPTGTYLTEACGSISVTTKIGNTSTTTTTQDIDENDILLSKGEYKKVTVIVAYTGDKRADGDFKATFGDITLNYSSTK